MTVPKVHVNLPQQIPLIDDPRVAEVYVDQLAGVSFSNGNFNFTFAVVRGDHTKDPSPNVRQVTARMVMPAPAVGEFIALVGQMMKGLEEKGIFKKIPTLNVIQ